MQKTSKFLVCLLLAFACSDESLECNIRHLSPPNLPQFGSLQGKGGCCPFGLLSKSIFPSRTERRRVCWPLRLVVSVVSLFVMTCQCSALCKPREHNRGENVVKLTKQANIKGCFSWTLTDNICTGLHYYIQLSYPSH